MLRICLVEDEEYTLRGLCQKIMDLDGDYQVVGTAYNGVDALDVIRDMMPDMVITDIRMPDMDGIALTERINERYPGIITVIISGYQEFSYAKTAMKLGVRDYLLKPVAADELKDCLAKCRKMIEQKRNQAHIADILSDGTPAVLGGMDHCLIYLVFGNAVTAGAESIIHPNGLYIPSQEIESRFRQITGSGEHLFCYIGVYSNEKVVIAQKQGASERVFRQKLEELAATFEREYRCPVTIAFRSLDNAAVIEKQIRTCRKIAVQGILLGTSNVVSDISVKEPAGSTNDLASYLSLCLRRGQLDPLKERINRLFAEWYEIRQPVRMIYNDLIYITNSLKHSLAAQETAEYTVTDYIDDIVSVSGNHRELAANYCDLLQAIFAPVAESSRSLSSVQLVEKIEKYFQSNLANDVTLTMLCEEMNYSKVYLCRLFKSMKNTSPIDYFIQLKIEKAKSLFRECPSMSIKDVSESLGFSDSYYFSKVFKRITGLTPSAAKAKELGR